MPLLLLLAPPHSVPATAVCGHRPTAHLRCAPRLPPPNPKPKPRRLPPPLKCAHRPSATSPHPPLNPNPSLLDGFLLVVSFLGILPRDSPDRWRRLLAISEEAESRLAGIPPHLIHAITSSEDRRFFFHPGIDCHGISRAIVKYPNGGGGSTITQQLMKRIFLTSERKISRKLIEGILSLMIEKGMSKTKIFYSYLSTMYWGHGIFGIESASSFYFQKQPFFLTVGESALLAGILPAPEILNPFTDPRRGKSAQQRVLRRMVAEGFIDMETALEVAKQPLRLLKEDKEILV